MVGRPRVPDLFMRFPGAVGASHWSYGLYDRNALLTAMALTAYPGRLHGLLGDRHPDGDRELQHSLCQRGDAAVRRLPGIIGRLTFFGTALAGAIGGTIGSLVSYYIGLFGGRPFLDRYGRYLGATPGRLALAESWFARYDIFTVFFTRLLPVIRTFISLPAGVARVNIVLFTLYTFLGTLIWSLFLVYVGFVLGAHWEIVSS